MDSSNSNLFEIYDLVRAKITNSVTDVDRLTARTRIGRKIFHDGIRSANLRSLNVGDQIDLLSDPNALAVGIATYSNEQMQLLNRTWKVLRQRRAFIFDIDSFISFDQLACAVPGIAPFVQTPVLFEYGNGLLMRSLEGREALQTLSDFACCLESKE